eukprot:Rmarinus@m.9642
MEFTPLMRGDSSGMRGESSAPDPLPHSLPSMDEDGLMGRGRGVPPPPLDEPSRRRPGASFPRPRPKLMGSGTGPTLVQGSPGQMGGVPGRPDAAAGIGQPGQPPGSGAPGSDSVRLLALIRRKLRDTEVRLQLESQIKNGLEDTVTNLLRENEKLRKDNGELKQRHMDLKVEQLEWTEWKMREKKAPILVGTGGGVPGRILRRDARMLAGNVAIPPRDKGGCCGYPSPHSSVYRVSYVLLGCDSDVVFLTPFFGSEPVPYLLNVYSYNLEQTILCCFVLFRFVFALLYSIVLYCDFICLCLIFGFDERLSRVAISCFY